MAKKGKRRLPNAAFPTAAERSYTKLLLARTKALHTETMKALEPLLKAEEEEQTSRTDSFRLDAAPLPKRLIERLKVAFQGISLEGALTKMASVVEMFTTKQTQDQVKTVIDIKAFPDDRAKGLSKAWTNENVSLISSIDERYFADIERVVETAFREGQAISTLRGELERRYEVSQSRAELIARDQISKLNADVREYRHRQLGITSYVWSTSGDERVRESHQDLDGETFSYDDPPVINEAGETGHPGQDFQCRCVAIPVIPGEGE